MKKTFEDLHSNDPKERINAFLEIEGLLPELKSIEHAVRSEFIAFGRSISKMENWNEGSLRRFTMCAISIENAAKLAGFVVDENGDRVK